MSYVYVMGTSVDGSYDYIKIGLAKDPFVRLRELQTGNPKRMSIAGSFGPMPRPWAMDLERALHDLLSPERRQGEWFEVNYRTLGVLKMFRLLKYEKGCETGEFGPSPEWLCNYRKKMIRERAEEKSEAQRKAVICEEEGESADSEQKADTGQAARNRRWRLKNREKYNAYMRKYRNERK